MAVERLLRERSHVLAQPAQVGNSSEASHTERALRLLWVEDDPDQRRLFTAMVERWSYPVELSTASDGFEGLVRIGEIRPDMVITDLNMPGMDGFQMIRALMRQGSGLEDLCLVVLTAYSLQEITEHGGLPEAVRIFHKPAPLAEMEAVGRERWQRLQAGSVTRRN